MGIAFYPFHHGPDLFNSRPCSPLSLLLPYKTVNYNVKKFVKFRVTTDPVAEVLAIYLPTLALM
jgi:hypothetical protein